eukprot:Hpha_TRINITY_DN4881_c0_g1::TRINITY_DN4881_c0_g1_i2::g.20215::m.20215
MQPVVVSVLTGLVVALVASRVGALLQVVVGMPAVSGYIAVGLLSGGSALGVLGQPSLAHLKFARDAGLAMIGFAAGLEMAVPRLRQHGRSVFLTVIAVVPAVWGAVYLAALRTLPSLPESSPGTRWAAAGLVATVMCARSPASAIAVVKEQEARGPLTSLVVCASIAIDITVVAAFGPALQLAAAIVGGGGITAAAVAIPLAGVFASAVVGFLVWRILSPLLLIPRSNATRGLLAVAAGYSVTVLTGWVRGAGFVIRLDPLIVCAAAGASAVNAGTAVSDMFEEAVQHALPVTNVLFFTLVGAGVPLAMLPQACQSTPYLVGARFVALIFAAFVSSWMEGRSGQANATPWNIRWAGFVTQAGVAVALCKSVGQEFPDWGPPVEAALVSAVLCNLLLGPPLFQWALKRVGEAGAAGVLAEAVFVPKTPLAPAQATTPHRATAASPASPSV